MKFISTTVKSAIGATGIAAASIFAAATAVAAPPTMGGFGTSEQLMDGPLITNYTVSNLQPANVTIPGYMPQGQLYQANVTAQANSGAVTPVVSDFNDRAASGQQYRVIDTVPVPNGLSPPRFSRATSRPERSTSTSPARSLTRSCTTTARRKFSCGPPNALSG